MSGQLSQKAAMFRRWSKMLTGGTDVAVRQGVGRAYSTEGIEGYYNDLTGKVSTNAPFDERGVVQSVKAGSGRCHFPIAVAQYALGCYDLHLLSCSGEAGGSAPGGGSYLDSFMANADWLLSAQRADGSWDAFGPIGYTRYSVSSMAQGEGASALLRAYVETGSECYLDAARRAVGFMLRPLSEGGTSVYEGERLYLEEYPQAPRRSVLNGWAFSLFGLYDMSLVDGELRAGFDRSAETMAASLGSYDCGYWSLYDLEGRMASPAYHDLHIALLEVMAELTGDGRFACTAGRFSEYQSRGACKARAVSKKVAQKLTEHTEGVIVQ